MLSRRKQQPPHVKELIVIGPIMNKSRIHSFHRPLHSSPLIPQTRRYQRCQPVPVGNTSMQSLLLIQANQQIRHLHRIRNVAPRRLPLRLVVANHLIQDISNLDDLRNASV